jgi:two-component system, cell cycle response regulator
MCDVDHFKQVNDTHGHLIGDAVLRWFAAKLQTAIRTCDWAARYGGEEFLILLPETNVSNAAAAAEHLRAQISGAPFESEGVSLTVTASFGVAGWKAAVPQGASLDALIARCDAGVYASKTAGRNKVSVEVMG